MISFRVYRRDDLLVADRRPTTAMRGSLLFLLAGCCRDGHTVAANTPAAQHEHVRPVPRGLGALNTTPGGSCNCLLRLRLSIYRLRLLRYV